MSSPRTSIFRVAAAAIAILGLSAGALAADRHLPMRGFFNCNAQATNHLFNLPGTDQWLPESLDVMVAGAGTATWLQGPVVCFSDNEHIDMFTMTATGPQFIGVGGLTSIMRDRNGDTIVMKMEMYVDLVPTSADHPITFHGTYTITGGTGRFAGATGAGEWRGWANNDDNPPADPAAKPSAQGYWQFAGTLVLPGLPHGPCGGGK